MTIQHSSLDLLVSSKSIFWGTWFARRLRFAHRVCLSWHLMSCWHQSLDSSFSLSLFGRALLSRALCARSQVWLASQRIVPSHPWAPSTLPPSRWPCVLWSPTRAPCPLSVLSGWHSRTLLGSSSQRGAPRLTAKRTTFFRGNPSSCSSIWPVDLANHCFGLIWWWNLLLLSQLHLVCCLQCSASRATS